ncbi:MAG: cobalamin-binding protein [Pseudomonadales bacterium]|nr:cobalamin-binding protein [Pseudomonadales bacterium]
MSIARFVSRLLLLFFCWFTATIAGEIRVTDDTGKLVELAEPARRIVSLSPHITEILFSLEAGDTLAGTVRFSNYPPAAREVPRVGDAFSVNVETIVSLEPDLILAWATGGADDALERLKALGIPVYTNRATSLDDIGASVRRIGHLIGKRELGERLATEYLQELHGIRQRENAGDRSAIFFQISDQSLYTVSNEHLIGQAIELCGGRNIFGDAPVPVPMVSTEAVLAANPDLILISQPETGVRSPWVEKWRHFESLEGKIRTLDADLISRPSLRMLEGVKKLCSLI